MNKYIVNYLALSIFLSLSISAQAGMGSWGGSIAVEGARGGFGGETNRDALGATGLLLDLNYLERVNIGIALRKAKINLTGEDPALKQDEKTVYIEKHFHSDTFNGRFTLNAANQKIDGYTVDANTKDTTTTTGVAFKYINNKKDLSLDIHRSASTYKNKTAVTQLDASIGVQFFSPSNWLQLRGYSIDVSIKDLNVPPPERNVSYGATDVMLTHWMTTEKLFGIDKVFVAMLSGDRRYAHDPDSYTTWNLSEVQTGYNRIGVEWDLANNSTLVFVSGTADYELMGSEAVYDNTFHYLSFKKAW